MRLLWFYIKQTYAECWLSKQIYFREWDVLKYYWELNERYKVNKNNVLSATAELCMEEKSINQAFRRANSQERLPGGGAAWDQS